MAKISSVKSFNESDTENAVLISQHGEKGWQEIAIIKSQSGGHDRRHATNIDLLHGS